MNQRLLAGELISIPADGRSVKQLIKLLLAFKKVGEAVVCLPKFDQIATQFSSDQSSGSRQGKFVDFTKNPPQGQTLGSIRDLLLLLIWSGIPNLNGSIEFVEEPEHVHPRSKGWSPCCMVEVPAPPYRSYATGEGLAVDGADSRYPYFVWAAIVAGKKYVGYDEGEEQGRSLVIL